MTVAAAPWGEPLTAGATLGHHLRHWLRFPSPRLLLALVLGALLTRFWLGGFSWIELLVPVGILAVQPFTEWLIHVHVLHFRARTWGGREIDLHLAREHRAHHRAPTDLAYVFIPLRSLVAIVGVALALLWLVGAPWTLTFVASGAAMALAYEWVHYLVHSTHRPRTETMKRLRRLHLLHHYKNESYWMGVTRHLADRFLGTLPDPSTVEISPTARTLAGPREGPG